MPFVTEEIWQKLPRPGSSSDSLMVTTYPRSDERFRDAAAERVLALLQEVTGAIRTIRSTYSVPPSATIAVELRCPAADKRALLTEHRSIVENAARVSLEFSDRSAAVPQSAKSVVGADIEVIVPLEGLVDIAAERQRIGKELARTDKEIAFVRKKLDNSDFMARAPAEVVEKERERLAEEQARRERLVQALSALE
jgi:valyl-tRNA synthetase